ncbi:MULTISPECIES: 4-aminobutyrate--2-oxoglutarate transaminase [Kocuria]|uniref:4-aminobutyrate--2-oxoglutarate transaminase n=1 Tax=Kocuria TaxID=57493 RepID=UPI0007EB3042|nr:MULTISPECIES: 4-aminobutyrate--2-oxoglutarate transaminase [Kocuria]MBN6812613.1 4-aminobutyrate--2-oxoglutarate transaminase [Kocuria indica]MBN6844369.1 4-aminobutyrate--2-oxoglutarate transaminase [Kocuria indica]MCT1723342.1 4-aminobutyrate--2-oxoglutarate transaminase [Kocuria marina]MCT1735828.1 4-aminobutyrate--2-oxoglutarate transaminase [Kocuria marina]MCT2361473.1 4-aminobutyrate--2-oxoglutarate transaminase [Kocuria marina]
MADIEYRLEQKRDLKTALPGPKSQELAARREKAVAAGVASSVPVYADELDGGIIKDADGNQLIDLGSGIAVTSVGATAPKVVEKVREAVGKFTHTCFMVTPYEGYVEVAEKIASLTPGAFDKRAALFNSGSEAVENAVKIARMHTKRNAVVVFDHAYHGRTNLTLAMTSKVMPYKQGFGPFANEVYRVPMSYPFRDPEGMTGEDAAKRALSLVEKQVGAENVAAIVIEPIQGEGGFIVPAPGFLPALSQWCKDNGAVFVADEVQAGVARTGKWFSSEYEGVEPDLVTFAKGIAGGMPLSGVVGRAELVNVVHGGGLGGTYGGNPVACAAALGAIETIEDWNLADRALEIEKIIKDELGSLAESSPIVGELRGRGAMMALEFVKPGSKEPNADAAKQIAAKCLEQGVVILTCGTFGNNVRLLPPLVIDFDLLREGLRIFSKAIEEVGA